MSDDDRRLCRAEQPRSVRNGTERSAIFVGRGAARDLLLPRVVGREIAV
jgi:hypothetical protein